MIDYLDTKNEAISILNKHRIEWQLEAMGNCFFTHSSLLQFVRYRGDNAIIKIAMEAEELAASKLMIWWNGKASAPILAHSNEALLMFRLENRMNHNLVDMAINGQDEEATKVICQVGEKLHQQVGELNFELKPLKIWFSNLFEKADIYGGNIRLAKDLAEELLNNEQDIRILHGDLHHQNILYSDTKGWAAIDPKCLYGERGFDFANIVCNPNLELALSKNRLERQIDTITKETDMDKDRFTKWVIAWSALSASWILDDGDDAKLDLAILERALALI